MGDILVLILLACTVMCVGVYPVISRVHTEKNPSPWSYAVPVSSSTEHAGSHAATVNVNEPIPTTSIVPFEVASNQQESANYEAVSGSEETMTASLPNQEGMDSIASLLKKTMEFSTEEPEIEGFAAEQPTVEENLPSLPTLTAEQYAMIKLKFGEKVANLITCTPYQGCLGEQIMIGTFFKENGTLQFGDQSVELVGNIEDEIDGETIVIKGSFLADGKFYVQHWEDPEMVEQGYSSLKENIANVN